MSDARKAGWYDDPNAPGMVRWWDGGQWANMSMPRDLAPKPPSTAEKVAVLAGTAAKVWFLLLLLVVCALLLYIAL